MSSSAGMMLQTTKLSTVLVLFVVLGLCGRTGGQSGGGGGSRPGGSVSDPTSEWNGGSGAIECNDETFQTVECPSDGSCIPVDYVCDGYNDCEDGYDEAVCDSINVCINDDPCLNGATCYFEHRYNETYCFCPDNFFGEFCQYGSYICSSNSVCLNGGTCYIIQELNEMHCYCPDQFYGDFCQYVTSPCSSTVCLNGGSCLVDRDDIDCICPRGFTGKYCEQVINVCDSNPCENGGLCITTSWPPTSYECTCPIGWTGDNCQIAADDGLCVTNYCLNGGTCFLASATAATYTCACPSDWTGNVCQEQVACASNPCENGGTCYATSWPPTSYACACPRDSTGSHCEDMVINVCDSDPCQNGGTCFTTSWPPTSYVCACSIGWMGNNCQVAVGYCTPEQCQNGGTCIVSTDSSMCLCPDQFTGDSCQFEIFSDPCADNPCGSNGLCGRAANSENAFTCTCAEGWSGQLCTVNIDGSSGQSLGLVIGAVGGGVLVLIVLVIVIVVAVMCCRVTRNKHRNPPRLSADPTGNALVNPGYQSQNRSPPGYAPSASPPSYDYAVNSGPAAAAAPPPPPPVDPRPLSATPSGYQIPLQPLAPSSQKAKKGPSSVKRTPQEEYVYASNIYEEIPDNASQAYMTPDAPQPTDTNQKGGLKGDQEYMELSNY